MPGVLWDCASLHFVHAEQSPRLGRQKIRYTWQLCIGFIGLVRSMKGRFVVESIHHAEICKQMLQSEDVRVPSVSGRILVFCSAFWAPEALHEVPGTALPGDVDAGLVSTCFDRRSWCWHAR